MVRLISRRQQRSLHQQRGYCFLNLLLNDESTNILTRSFVTNNQLSIDYALKEQHSLKRKKSFNNDQQTNSAIKNNKSRVIVEDSKFQK